MGLVRIYRSMRTKTAMIVAVMLAMASAAHAKIKDDCQAIGNGYGDMNLLTLGGFTFAMPISIGLNPTHAPMAGARYSVRCQIVYLDRNTPRPKTKYEKKLARNVGKYLNARLKEFFSSQYGGMGFADLLSVYYDGWLYNDVNERFPAYVAEQIGEMEPDGRPDIKIIAVTVNAEGELKDVLSEIWSRQTK